MSKKILKEHNKRVHWKNIHQRERNTILLDSLNRHRDRQKDRQVDRQTDRQTDAQADRQTDRQTHRRTDRQTDWQTARPKEIPQALPLGFPSGLGYISSYIPPLVTIQIQSSFLKRFCFIRFFKCCDLSSKVWPGVQTNKQWRWSGDIGKCLVECPVELQWSVQ